MDSYVDFEIHIFTQNQQTMLDINGRPNAVNLPTPIALPATAQGEPFHEVFELPAEQVAALGNDLFHLAFAPAVEAQFQAYLARCAEHEGVRICISAEASTLASATWEILCGAVDPTRQFLSLSPRTPVVRTPRVGQPVYLRALEKPLRILVLLASPTPLPAIDSAKEKALWEEALRPLRESHQLDVGFLGFDGRHEGTFDQLQQALSTPGQRYDIVHIISHGLLEPADEGKLALPADVGGAKRTVNASSLANLFRDRGVMLAVLQACSSGAILEPGSAFASVAHQLLGGGVPAVLAMQAPVYQDEARRFMETLYTTWLRSECRFEDAVTQARHTIYEHAEGLNASWAIPVLYLSPGVQLTFHKPPVPGARLAPLPPPREERQLEAALPEQCRLGKETELVMLIRSSEQPGLEEMIRARPSDFEVAPEDVRRSSSFEVAFPLDPATQALLPRRVKLVLASEDFALEQPTQIVEIRPQGDSVLRWFLLKPLHEGRARVLVTLADADDDRQTLAQLRLATMVRGGEAFEAAYQVVGPAASSRTAPAREPAPAMSQASAAKGLSELQDFATSVLSQMKDRLERPFTSHRDIRMLHDSMKRIESELDTSIKALVNMQGQHGRAMTFDQQLRELDELLQLCIRIKDRSARLQRQPLETYTRRNLGTLKYELDEVQTRLPRTISDLLGDK